MRPPGTPEPPEVPLAGAGTDPRPDGTSPPDAHVAAGRLAAVALGDPAGAADRAHLLACTRCRDDLAELVALTGVGRADDRARPVAPPAGLWARIAADAGVAADAPRPSLAPSPSPLPSLSTPTVAGPPTPGAAVPSDGPPARERPVDPPRGGVPRPRRARRVLPVAAALVLGLVLGAGGLAAVRAARAPEGGRPPVVATAALGPVGAAVPGADGTAVLRDAGGARTLEVDVAGLPAPTGYYELWLLDPAGGLVSLGVVAGGRVVVDLPADLDLARYPVVDVSDEPLDGDPAHSAESVLRGSIEL